MKDLSTGELAELRQNFDTCDANGDGWIVVTPVLRSLVANRLRNPFPQHDTCGIAPSREMRLLTSYMRSS